MVTLFQDQQNNFHFCPHYIDKREGTIFGARISISLLKTADINYRTESTPKGPINFVKRTSHTKKQEVGKYFRFMIMQNTNSVLLRMIFEF